MAVTRRQAREFALQMLYQIDMSGAEPRQAVALFRQCFQADVALPKFTSELVEGAWRERDHLDKLIAQAAENWRIGRLPRVDLNLLRLGAYELLAYPQLPAQVTINEAIEIARVYCGDEAPVFINGVLDRIASVTGKKAQANESSQ
ncbi:MAG: transcription antitermination factor NusB [Candidatus Binatia bacterium]